MLYVIICKWFWLVIDRCKFIVQHSKPSLSNRVKCKKFCNGSGLPYTWKFDWIILACHLQCSTLGHSFLFQALSSRMINLRKTRLHVQRATITKWLTTMLSVYTSLFQNKCDFFLRINTMLSKSSIPEKQPSSVFTICLHPTILYKASHTKHWLNLLVKITGPHWSTPRSRWVTNSPY